MSLAQGNNTPTRPRIEPGSPDPESDALTTRPGRPPKIKSTCKSVLRKPPTHNRLLASCNLMHINLIIKNTVGCYMLSENSSNLEYDSKKQVRGLDSAVVNALACRRCDPGSNPGVGML